MQNYDWAWPMEIDRETIESLSTPEFLESRKNAILAGILCNENLEMMLISIEEYLRFRQIVEELESLMWQVKNQNEVVGLDEE